MNIFNEIQMERSHQVRKWGAENDNANTPFHWAAYITQYATRHLIGIPLDATDLTTFRTDMIKVAALAVAAIEAIDAKE